MVNKMDPGDAQRQRNQGDQWEKRFRIYSHQRLSQGGCLSPLLWSLVMDEYINILTDEGFHITAYADDVAITIQGKTRFLGTLADMANQALKKTELWCNINGLKVHPDKTSFMVINKARKELRIKNLKIYHKNIESNVSNT